MSVILTVKDAEWFARDRYYFYKGCPAQGVPFYVMLNKKWKNRQQKNNKI